MRSLTGLGGSVAIGFGAVLVLIWLAQRSLIYFPARDTPTPAAYGLPRAQAVGVTTDDGLALTAWYGGGASQRHLEVGRQRGAKRGCRWCPARS